MLSGINDASALKYNSETAQGIRSVSEKAGTIVAATAFTIATGGAGAAVVGGLYGIGKSAEHTYQKSTDTTMLQEAMILGSGGLNALSWFSTGALGASMLNVASSAAEAGGLETAKTVLKFAFSKENLREVFSVKNSAMNLFASLSQSGGEIANIATKVTNGEEVSTNDYIKLGGEILLYFGANTLDDLLKGGIKSHDMVLKSGQDIGEALYKANLPSDEVNKIIPEETPLNEMKKIQDDKIERIDEDYLRNNNIEFLEDDPEQIEALRMSELNDQAKLNPKSLEAQPDMTDDEFNSLRETILNEHAEKQQSLSVHSVENYHYRQFTSEEYKGEFQRYLLKKFGIDNPEITNKLHEALIGELYADTGVATGDWDSYIEIIKPYLKESIQKTVQEKGGIVFWSKIEEEFLSKMNNKYTTVGSSILGEEFDNIDQIYTNWSEYPEPRFVEFWEKLSEAYAEACSEIVDPATGKNIDSIKFLFPESYSLDNCFGNIFKKSELPTLLSNGDIKTITMSKVNQETMEIIETVDIDISEISKYYQENNVGLGSRDIDLNSEVFDMFVNKIKEAM